MKSTHPHQHATPETQGLVIRWPGFYDLVMKVFWLGRESRIRDRVIATASLRQGEAVLDVGCGTGTLAIAAARSVGEGGRVCGVDPSAEMIARARKKAAAAAAQVELEVGLIESLEFPPETFDVVFCTLVFHHLPDDELQRRAFAELRRVLKPGGRLVMADFGGPRQLERFERDARAVGFEAVETSRVGPRFHFALVARVAGTSPRS